MHNIDCEQSLHGMHVVDACNKFTPGLPGLRGTALIRFVPRELFVFVWCEFNRVVLNLTEFWNIILQHVTLIPPFWRDSTLPISFFSHEPTGTAFAPKA